MSYKIIKIIEGKRVEQVPQVKTLIELFRLRGEKGWIIIERKNKVTTKLYTWIEREVLWRPAKGE